VRFRDFVELTRDALESVAFRLDGERTITPMLHLESELGVSHVGVDDAFFHSSAAVRLLVHRYVLPLIAQDHARKVAWSYCVWAAPAGGGRPAAHPERRELLLATFIDGEVIEHWGASLIRTGGPVLVGGWHAAMPTVSGGGPMLSAVQKALR
jgi:hypothetical protein